jgi:cephalosporin-C deacetylase
MRCLLIAVLTALSLANHGAAMEMNLNVPWGDRCSPPLNPFVSFHSAQATDLMFNGVPRIELVCQVNLRASGMKWSLHRNLFAKPFRTGTAEARLSNRFGITIETADLLPGFYDVRVVLDSAPVRDEKDVITRRPAQAVCTFGWKVSEMAIRDTRPADFAAFWTKARAEIDMVTLDAHEGSLQTFDKSDIETYNLAGASLPADFDPQGHRSERVQSGKVDFAGPAGGRVYGWLAKPEGEGPFPAMLILPGAGITSRPRPLEHARHGYVALDIQIHGLEVDLKEYPRMPGYFDGHVYDPIESYYFYRVHQRCLQAVNYLLSRTDVDPKRIVVVGGSQGGRLSTVVASLDHRIAAAVPAIANAANQPYARWAAMCSGYTEMGGVFDAKRTLEDGMQSAVPPLLGDAAERCLAYYDPMNFAPDITCPVMFNAGLTDAISAPTCVFSIWNRIPGSSKQMAALDGLGHDWCPEFDRRAFRWLDQVLANPQPR